MTSRSLLAVAVVAAVGCASAPPVDKDKKALMNDSQEIGMTADAEATAFLSQYNADLSAKEKVSALAWWTAANSGAKADFEAQAAADLAMRMVHADKARYAKLKRVLERASEMSPVILRSLRVAELGFRGEQLPPETLEKLVKTSAEIEQVFATYRPTLNGKQMSGNDLIEILKTEKNSAKRQAAWAAYKQVGAQIAPKLVALAKLRNEAAKELGFDNYWRMQMTLQEHDPDAVIALFDELDRLTDGPFKAMKATMDAEIGKRLGVKATALMPWHYDNPFFQDPPPSPKLDLDVFYKSMKKEDIVSLAETFYSDIGLDAKRIIGRSDFYERAGKNPHAYCTTIDRGDDVRMLLNIRPTESWMGTMLHETGHGVYFQEISQELPFNLRNPAHTLTTEAVAMLFGALSKNPLWLTSYAKADAKVVSALESEILEQRRREQLVFARWGLVMLNFERALYENPDADLDTLWVATVKRYQGLNYPAGRPGDWAAKPHFTIAPVYYHNYVMAELFAAQVRAHLAVLANHTGKTASLSFNGRRDFGQYLNDKVFKPGMSRPWREFVVDAVGEPYSAKAFASEVN